VNIVVLHHRYAGDYNHIIYGIFKISSHNIVSSVIQIAVMDNLGNTTEILKYEGEIKNLENQGI